MNAQDIQLIGMTPTFVASAINVISFSTGNAGNLTVNTQQLSLLEGGRISSSTYANGNGGSVTVKATEEVKIAGSTRGAIKPSYIAASAVIADPILQKILGLSASPSGASGNVTLDFLQKAVMLRLSWPDESHSCTNLL